MIRVAIDLDLSPAEQRALFTELVALSIRVAASPCVVNAILDVAVAIEDAAQIDHAAEAPPAEVTP